MREDNPLQGSFLPRNMLQSYVVVRVQQIALVVDKPVIAGRVPVDVAIGASRKSYR